MKVIIFGIALIANGAFAAPGIAAKLVEDQRLSARDVAKTLTESRTFGTLVEHLQPTLDVETANFLRGKIKGVEKSPLQIKQVGDLKFQIRSGSLNVAFEIHEYKFDGIVEIEINHHVIRTALEEKPEIVWQKIGEALPRTTASYWSPFPTANARPLTDLERTSEVFGVQITAHGAPRSYAQNDHCRRYSSYINSCQDLSPEMLKRAAEFGNSWPVALSFLYCRPEKKDLRRCLQERARAIGYKPPGYLAGYFDLKASELEVNVPTPDTAN